MFVIVYVVAGALNVCVIVVPPKTGTAVTVKDVKLTRADWLKERDIVDIVVAVTAKFVGANGIPFVFKTNAVDGGDIP